MARLPKGTPTLRDVLREQRRQLRAQGGSSRFAGSGFKVGADGSVTATGVTATSVTVGPVRVTADGAVTTTGSVTAGSATVGTLNAGTSNAFTVAANGAVTAPSVTTTGAVAASGAVTGGNTGGNFAVTGGRVSITPTAANTPTSLQVNFPVGRFTTFPNVVATVETSLAGSSVTVTNISATGCQLWLTATATGARLVQWVAVST